jgi:hypothetical protein
VKKENKTKERSFTLELKSRKNLKNINVNNGSQESVLIEGNLGKLEHACFVADDILEIVGQAGVLRVNLEEKELTKGVKN